MTKSNAKSTMSLELLSSKIDEVIDIVSGAMDASLAVAKQIPRDEAASYIDMPANTRNIIEEEIIEYLTRSVGRLKQVKRQAYAEMGETGNG